jgi:hypothetical protein
MRVLGFYAGLVDSLVPFCPAFSSYLNGYCLTLFLKIDSDNDRSNSEYRPSIIGLHK